MTHSIHELLDLFRANRFQDVINAIDLNSFSAIQQPSIANIVAAAYFKLGDYKSSLTLLTDIESCFVDDIEYLSLYGSCLRRQGDLHNARIQFQRALNIDSSSPALQNNYANLLIDLGLFEEAETILNSLLLKNPAYGDAKANLDRLKERVNFSVADVQATASDTDANWEVGNPLLLAFSSDEVQKAASLLKSDIKLINKTNTLSQALPSVKDQQIASDQLKMAQQAILDGRFDFALQLCSQAKLFMHDSPAIYECASDAYIAKKCFHEAEICLLHTLKLGATSFKIFVNLVSLTCMRGDFGLAQHYYESAFSIDSANSVLPQLREQITQGLNNQTGKLFRFDMDWSSPQVSLKST